MFAEFDVRTEFARLRRLASEKAIRDPENWE
jgi:hypothetical protein